MNNRQLTIFRTVCEEGSMTKTAEKLYMTQPAVSQTIKELEQESGVCFLERYNRKVVPTESGRLLYQYACHILGLYQDLEQLKRNGKGCGQPVSVQILSVGDENAAWIYQVHLKKSTIYPSESNG